MGKKFGWYMSCIISLSLVMGDFTTLNIVDMLNRVLRIDLKKTPRTFKIPLRTALRIYIYYYHPQ